jgi:hypothetical protein
MTLFLSEKVMVQVILEENHKLGEVDIHILKQASMLLFTLL